MKNRTEYLLNVIQQHRDKFKLIKKIIAYSKEYRLRNQVSRITELISSTFYNAFTLLLYCIVNSCIVEYY